MRPRRYVGCSGVTTPEQARALLDAWPADAPPQSLMIGVLASQKTMSGGECNARSPRPEDIHKIWPSDPRALNMIHFFTKEPDTICPQVLRALRTAGDACHGVRVNVPWPHVPSLQAVRFHFANARIVLQVGPRAMTDLSAEAIVGRVASYRGAITDVLFDASAGTGTEWSDPIRRWRVLEMLRSWAPELQLGIAGGLCAETLPDVADLVRDRQLSIDAEGRLRNERDELDLDKTRAYLAAAAPLVCGGG